MKKMFYVLLFLVPLQAFCDQIIITGENLVRFEAVTVLGGKTEGSHCYDSSYVSLSLRNRSREVSNLRINFPPIQSNSIDYRNAISCQELGNSTNESRRQVRVDRLWER